MQFTPLSRPGTVVARCSLGLLLSTAFLSAAQVSACGLHAFGFSPYAAHQAPRGGPALPAGTRLDVEGLVNVVPDRSAQLQVSFATPESFRDPALTVDGPAAVQFDGTREPVLSPVEGTLTLPFTAREGYHWLTLTLRGTVDGEVLSLVRRVYVAARPADSVALR